MRFREEERHAEVQVELGQQEDGGEISVGCEELCAQL